MNDAFWNHLLITATTIEELAQREDAPVAQMREHLESIEVVYERAFDPADAYAEYVAVTLCRSINRLLAKT